jgi:hypothetical protein
LTHISDTTECRRLARNVVTADFSDPQIISFQDKEYSLIATMTDKDDWDSLDREYGALQLVEMRLVAADIIQHYGDPENPGTMQAISMMRDSAMMELDKIIDNMDTEVASEEIEFQIAKTDAKGWGLNTGVLPPDRLSKTSTDIENF